VEVWHGASEAADSPRSAALSTLLQSIKPALFERSASLPI
jgi:hypothetical protein